MLQGYSRGPICFNYANTDWLEFAVKFMQRGTTLEYTLRFEALGMDDVDRVGGKNASLGEMISQLAQAGVKVPGGFATTAAAYREFVAHNSLADRIDEVLNKLDVNDVDALTAAGNRIRQWIVDAPLQPALVEAISNRFRALEQGAGSELAVAVRSSATAEDLPDASFAGQQETFLNVRGLDNVLLAIKQVFASLYNDRAIAYRVHHGFDHADVALSAGVQRMVRSDIGASGVMFTLDTESGFPRCGVHHRRLRTGRDRGAGRSQSGRILRPQADSEPPADRPSCAATSAARPSR